MYTPKEYQTYLEMDGETQHLLTEGPNDTIFFEILFEEFLGTEWREHHKVAIDNAETILSQDGHAKGNREKVEDVCKTYAKDNLLGFVDREFRFFDVEEKLIDKLTKHYQNNKIIWSRGHSIENYYFDSEILRDAFKDICGNEFRKAHQLFQSQINSYMQTACVLSLVGLMQNNRIEDIKNSIGWNIISLNGNLEINVWKNELLSRTKFTEDEVKQIIGSLPRLYSLTKEADADTVRWFCHGHIGSSVLWCSFARCIYEALNDETKKRKTADAFLSYKKKIGAKICARAWARASTRKLADYPVIIFELFNLKNT